MGAGGELVDEGLGLGLQEVEVRPAAQLLPAGTHVLGGLAQAPCSIICGTEDRMTRVGHSRKLHARIHGSDLFEAVGAGHMVILESHDEVNRELDDLFARASLLAKERDL